ncbi:hypothetical protein CKO15_12985 [Halorhodospira abdelmalekii]|uniref:hypothetical protein n=1 Tax=Halorhodospira abdelmalekii TaxID=421629 RepID=UPI001904D6E9|nr:hypothetical protein [Halorhodospira abdelmalekii]MBK1736170.1 hypothetical protein [Halorhodospira abdelmalekii]
MSLAEKDHEKIDAYIQAYLERWLAEREQRLTPLPPVYDRELHGRIVRVEEALKHQGELMERGFAQMEKRFEQVDKRFEQADKRFEAMQQQMDKRFEQVDNRFEAMQQQMDKRFEQVDKRFEAMQQQMDKRFEQVDNRFEEMIRRQDRQHHLVLGFIVGSLALMITVMLTAMRFMG